MAASTASLFTPLEVARLHWRETRECLLHPGGTDPDQALAVVEEFPLLWRNLAEAARHDLEAALSLAREIWDERERLQALGIRLPDWEAWRARLGL
ncbi:MULTISPECIES: hypothetical protein [unclassified Meiothermus]|uniref:hypothetical protein n=1 Tax=unclassified Meiothermus TaxID=370471 RepID=UPI000D7D05FF|nr:MULTISPECIES: hypothetical protein [unclassified Meiothermus]PZA06360.1 hypothetical protein DNA98_14045 [Meiothermus sp. Pnk-1]RYM35234.1 hypothetical protein EWH23_12145 [Meiothermus sp. PNK-Is4]